VKHPASLVCCILVVITLSMFGCGRAPARTVPLPDGGHASGSDLAKAVRGVCDAADQAAHQPAQAASTFYLRSHTELHSLASATALADRARAGRLLEAMYTVEQDIAAIPVRPALSADLGRLGAVAGEDLGVLHLAAPSCSRRTRP